MSPWKRAIRALKQPRSVKLTHRRRRSRARLPPAPGQGHFMPPVPDVNVPDVNEDDASDWILEENPELFGYEADFRRNLPMGPQQVAELELLQEMMFGIGGIESVRYFDDGEFQEMLDNCKFEVLMEEPQELEEAEAELEEVVLEFQELYTLFGIGALEVDFEALFEEEPEELEEGEEMVGEELEEGEEMLGGEEMVGEELEEGEEMLGGEEMVGEELEEGEEMLGGELEEGEPDFSDLVDDNPFSVLLDIEKISKLDADHPDYIGVELNWLAPKM